MKKLFSLLFLIFFATSQTISSQTGFKFSNPDRGYQKINFELINNLIVIPIEINGQELSFILDSGVSKTILFNLTENDSIGLNNVERVALQGLGGGDPIDALLSKNNTLKLGELESNNESIYVVLKDYFDLSGKMGTTIHGIIGYSLLRNFQVKINYLAESLKFYTSKKGNIKDCRRCEVLPIEFYRKKPYLKAKVQLDTVGNQLTDVKLLIDSGGSDALWLFEDSNEKIKTPKKFFKDILGEGLSGTIYGNRSRIKKVQLKSFELKEPTVSFLDSVSTRNARAFKSRNGSIGGEILRRFTVWFDYRNKSITLKKNGNFRKSFNYNMSGLYVAYNGKQLVKQENYNRITDFYNQEGRRNNTISLITSYSYKFKPSFKIKDVVEGSPAYNAGVLKNDIIRKINGNPVYNYNLVEINNILSSRDNRKLLLEVERNGKIKKFRFKLKKRV